LGAGKHDGGVKQTRRMYNAVGTMQRAYRRLVDANEAYARSAYGCSARQASMEVSKMFKD